MCTIITGTSSGIGSATTLLLAERAALDGASPNVTVLTMNVTDRDAVQAAFAAVEAAIGTGDRINLVNYAVTVTTEQSVAGTSTAHARVYGYRLALPPVIKD